LAVRLLIDSDICIDYLRGHHEAVDWLEKTTAPLQLFAVTVAELFAGVREGGERGYSGPSMTDGAVRRRPSRQSRCG
jgi:predicted nucleic acid-binding protein